MIFYFPINTFYQYLLDSLPCIIAVLKFYHRDNNVIIVFINLTLSSNNHCRYSTIFSLSHVFYLSSSAWFSGLFILLIIYFSFIHGCKLASFWNGQTNDISIGCLSKNNSCEDTGNDFYFTFHFLGSTRSIWYQYIWNLQ